MRNPQTLPESPATQPYHQGVKPAFAQQQPMGYASVAGNIQVAANNPNTGFQNHQQFMQQPMSPAPGYQGFPIQQDGSPQRIMANQSQPVTPTSLYGPSAATHPSWQKAPVQPVNPPMQRAMASSSLDQSLHVPANTAAPAPSNYHPAVDVDDHCFGPPMGGTAQCGTGMTLASLQSQGLVHDMGTLTVGPGEPQKYQNYAIPQQQNGAMNGGFPSNWAQQSGGPFSPPSSWGAPQQQQQQQASYASAANWNSLAQQQHSAHQRYPVIPGDGNGCSGGDGYQLPSLSHHRDSRTYGTTPYPVGNRDQNGISHPVPSKPHQTITVCPNTSVVQEEEEGGHRTPERPVADAKCSTDLMREHGAGLRALRLLEETNRNYHEGENDDEDDEDHERGGIIEALKLERAKIMRSKQLRKMKKLEFKNKMTEMLAESSRTVTSVRKGTDPELTSDKCKLDFDRQKVAQLKALKLMSLF